MGDEGTIAGAARVAAGVLQAHPDLVGIAGFDSESGPGIGQAIKEAGKTGQLVATAVEAEPQHLRFVKEGALTAVVAQKRELFTYYGVKVLHDLVHAPVRFTANDAAAGIAAGPTAVHTGTYTVTRANVDQLIAS
jgi:ABC-type sugar transport system substrate-binding protein